MNDQHMGSLCPDDDIQALVTTMQEGANDALTQFERTLDRYPEDPRLHFLHGSQLAARRDYADAQVAMRKAVELAPDFAIARFQLGFLQLTSGDADSALASWGPLHRLPGNHYLLLFVHGLTHLINDAFADAIETLERGISANEEIPPLNNDMQLIIAEARAKLDEPVDAEGEENVASSAHQLLQQAAFRSIKH